MMFAGVFGQNVFAKDEIKAIVNGQEHPGNAYEVHMGQTFTYSVIVSMEEGGAVGEPRLPDISGFNLKGIFPQTESRSQFINGSYTFTRKQIYNYQLEPQAPGDYFLTPAEVNVAGNTLRSNSVQIKVLKSAGNVRPTQPSVQNQQDEEDQNPTGDDEQDFMDQADKMFNQLLQRQLPQAQNVPDINPNEAFFIRAEVDKQKAYVGEQITASWYLYTQNNLTNFDPEKYPDLKGFWKEDIEIASRLNFSNVVVKGIPYKKALLISYALFPLKSGTATIDSLKLKATAIMTNPFGLFGKPYTFTKASPEIKVEVMPIPKENQPKDFTGAVGQFEMKASVDKTAVPANEPFTLHVRFDGRGNAKQIEMPPLELSDAFEQYDSKNDSKFMKDGTSYKEFEVLLIPRRTGEQTIPALSVSFFNPKTGKFERKSTAPIKIKVVEGKTTAANTQGSDFMQPTVQPQKQALPDWIYKEPRLSFNQAQLNRIWLAITILLLVALGFIAKKELKAGDSSLALLKEFQQRTQAIYKLQGEEKLREAAVHTMNLVGFVLQEMIDEKENHQISALLEKIPPSLSVILNDEFLKSLRYFETLGFAPEEAIQSLKDAKRFKSEFKALKQKLNEAIDAFYSSQK